MRFHIHSIFLSSTLPTGSRYSCIQYYNHRLRGDLSICIFCTPIMTPADVLKVPWYTLKHYQT